MTRGGGGYDERKNKNTGGEGEKGKIYISPNLYGSFLSGKNIILEKGGKNWGEIYTPEILCT